MSEGGGQRALIQVVGVVGVVAAILGGWMALHTDRTAKSDGGKAVGLDGPAEPGRQGGSAARKLPVRKGSLPTSLDGGGDPVLLALAPGLKQLRCSADGLELGAYDTRPAENHFADVLSNGLHIAVPGDSGRLWLERNVRAVAEVRWDDDTCVVTPVALVPVRGVLRQADGSPAVDHAVRGCIHGEFGRTDADGRWELMAVAGSSCHPMAFVEADDGGFGKSNVARVDVVAPGPMDGVVLSLPADVDLWGKPEQEKMAGQLAMMMGRMTERRRARLPELQAAADGLSGDAKTRADALVEREVDFLSMVDGELERLADPADQKAALRDAWLSLN